MSNRTGTNRCGHCQAVIGFRGPREHNLCMDCALALQRQAWQQQQLKGAAIAQRRAKGMGQSMMYGGKGNGWNKGLVKGMCKGNGPPGWDKGLGKGKDKGKDKGKNYGKNKGQHPEEAMPGDDASDDHVSAAASPAPTSVSVSAAASPVGEGIDMNFYPDL